MKSITVVPFGGLGNRLRVLNSINILNANLETKLIIAWLIKPELAISINKIFKSIGFSYKPINKFGYYIFLYFIKHIFINKYSKFYRFILLLYYDYVILDNDVTSKTQNELEEIFNNNKKIFIATCYNLVPVEDFNNFELTDEIKDEIDFFSKNWPHYVIGVHIRRGDHSIIIKQSSLEKYINKMNEFILKNKSICFFLATDDELTKKELLAIFPNNIITRKNSLNRFSVEGMKEGLIDLYLLAKTNVIICNLNSSYAELAQKIGQKKEIIEL